MSTMKDRVDALESRLSELDGNLRMVASGLLELTRATAPQLLEQADDSAKVQGVESDNG